jgi:hypothetical protein
MRIYHFPGIVYFLKTPVCPPAELVRPLAEPVRPLADYFFMGLEGLLYVNSQDIIGNTLNSS